MSSTGNASLPSTAEIPLPPGMTLDQFQDLQAQLIRVAIIAWVVFAVIVWDYFVQLPSEIALYMTKERNIWKTPATWWFIILRYSGIISTLPSLFFTAEQTNFCQVAISAAAGGAVLTTVSSGAIFWYRVRALWNGSMATSVIAGLFYVVMVACWIISSTQFRGDTGPRAPFTTNCQLLPVAPWAPMSYASSVAFDTCVLILTIAKFRKSSTVARSRIGQQVHNDNLFYFVLQTATNVVVLTIEAQQDPKFDLIKPTVVPFTTLMTVTMGTRVFLNLRLFNQRQKQSTENSLPLSFQGQSNPSNNTSSGSGILFNRPSKNQFGSQQLYRETFDAQQKVSTLVPL